MCGRLEVICGNVPLICKWLHRIEVLFPAASAFCGKNVAIFIDSNSMTLLEDKMGIV